MPPSSPQRVKGMRQFLASFVHRSLALWLGLCLCGGAGAQSPSSVAELQDRWVELLTATDGDISARTFEKVIGLQLLVTTHGSDGAITRSLRAT